MKKTAIYVRFIATPLKISMALHWVASIQILCLLLSELFNSTGLGVFGFSFYVISSFLLSFVVSDKISSIAQDLMVRARILAWGAERYDEFDEFESWLKKVDPSILNYCASLNNHDWRKGPIPR